MGRWSDRTAPATAMMLEAGGPLHADLKLPVVSQLTPRAHCMQAELTAVSSTGCTSIFYTLHIFTGIATGNFSRAAKF